MSNKWFVVDKGEEFGPFSGSQLKAMAMEGRLRRASLVKNDLSGKTIKAELLKGLEWPTPNKEEPNFLIESNTVAVLGTRKTRKAVPKNKEVEQNIPDKESEEDNLSGVENIIYGTKFYVKKAAVLTKKTFVDVKCKLAPDSKNLKEQSERIAEEVKGLNRPKIRIAPLVITWVSILLLIFYGLPSIYALWSMASSERYVYATNMLYRFYKLKKAEEAINTMEQVDSKRYPRFGTTEYEEFKEKRETAKANLSETLEKYRWFYAVSADPNITNVRLELGNSGIRGEVDSNVRGGKVTCYDRNGRKISKLSTTVDEDGEFIIAPNTKKDILKLDKIVVSKAMSKNARDDKEADDDYEIQLSSLKKAAAKVASINKAFDTD